MRTAAPREAPRVAKREQAFDAQRLALQRGYPSAPNLRERDPARYLRESDEYLDRGEILAGSYADVDAQQLFRRDLVETSMAVAKWARFTLRDPARAEALYRRAIVLQSGLSPVHQGGGIPHYWLADTLRFDLERPDEAVIEYRAYLQALSRRPARSEDPEASSLRAIARGVAAEIDFIENGRRFAGPVDPDSLVFGMFAIGYIAKGTISTEAAIAELWHSLRAHPPGANERLQAAAKLESLSPSNSRVTVTFAFLPVLGSAERIANYLRRHDPSAFQTTVAFAVARELAREARQRPPPAGSGMYIDTWSDADWALMRRAEAMLVVPGRR